MTSSSTSTAVFRYDTPVRPTEIEHITIYYDADMFAAWPFNHGLWAFDDEILVSFSRGPTSYELDYDTDHSVVDGYDGQYVTLRSTDGGLTWPAESLQVLGTHRSLERALLSGQAPAAPEEAFDFASSSLCLTAGFGLPPHDGPDKGYIQVSRNRGQDWDGPFAMPSFGFDWVQVKPDILVRPDGLTLLFVTVGRRTPERQGRGQLFVAVYATPDGGLNWHYLSAIHRHSEDAAYVQRYYASLVLLPDGRILAALRCQLDFRNAWPELFESSDGGRTWRFISRISDWGAPTDITLLDDGRLLAVYGYRVAPYGIRARVSDDDGRTWGPEIILRDDGGSADLGYPRVVKLRDGWVLAAYYFNRAGDPIQCGGGVRHIAATRFKP